jgi:hypothetical protein
MRIDLKPVATLHDDERAALKALTAAVYPPGVVAVSPGRHVHWAPPDSSVLVFTPEGELVSHVGLVVRTGTLDSAAVTIGGVGSVKTHPRAQGRGRVATRDRGGMAQHGKLPQQALEWTAYKAVGERGQVWQYHIPGLTTQQWGRWASAARLTRAAPNPALVAPR